MIRNRIPDVVVRRLVTYLSVLLHSDLEDGDFVSSAQLGDLAAVNGAQVRKDLALFGEFGKQESAVGEVSKESQDPGADRICLSPYSAWRTGYCHSPLYDRP